METFPEIIHLNVGGKHLSTRLSTLTKYPDSMLAAMFSGRHVADKDADGRYFVDCNGEIFELILEFLRFGALPSGEKSLKVYEMATYFVIQPLMHALELFQEVRNKIKVDAVKSSALPKEYESLKQKIIVALDTSRPLDRKEIVLYYKTSRRGTCVDPCQRNKETVNFTIQTELQLNFQLSEDFIFCLKEDLCRLGYGLYCHSYSSQTTCRRCGKRLAELIIILSPCGFQ